MKQHVSPPEISEISSSTCRQVASFFQWQWISWFLGASKSHPRHPHLRIKGAQRSHVLPALLYNYLSMFTHTCNFLKTYEPKHKLQPAVRNCFTWPELIRDFMGRNPRLGCTYEKRPFINLQRETSEEASAFPKSPPNAGEALNMIGCLVQMASSMLMSIT